MRVLALALLMTLTCASALVSKGVISAATITPTNFCATIGGTADYCWDWESILGGANACTDHPGISSLANAGADCDDPDTNGAGGLYSAAFPKTDTLNDKVLSTSALFTCNATTDAGCELRMSYMQTDDCTAVTGSGQAVLVRNGPGDTVDISFNTSSEPFATMQGASNGSAISLTDDVWYEFCLIIDLVNEDATLNVDPEGDYDCGGTTGTSVTTGTGTVANDLDQVIIQDGDDDECIDHYDNIRFCAGGC